MKNDNLSLDSKVDILKFLHQSQYNELLYRREREYKIFTWSSSILSALIGALLIAKQAAVIWNPYGMWGKVTASVAVLLIVIYSVLWQYKIDISRGQHTQVLLSIEELLHCFDKGFFTSDDSSLFPNEWANSLANMKISPLRPFISRFFSANFISATALLGGLSLIMIWVS